MNGFLWSADGPATHRKDPVAILEAKSFQGAAPTQCEDLEACGTPIYQRRDDARARGEPISFRLRRNPASEDAPVQAISIVVLSHDGCRGSRAVLLLLG